jgi:hypothetical protein
MSNISDSVGRGGANRPEDVRIVQELLNQHTSPPQQPLEVDGAVGPKTIAAIEAFQRNVVNMAHPDGRVDPGGRTFAALAGSSPAPSPAPSADSSSGLPPVSGGAGLTEADFQRAAAALNCEVACIKAVNDVESAGKGFLPSGRPKILFEAHIFSKRTDHQYDATHPDISSPHWNKALYRGGEKEYDRLEEAMTMNRQAAMESASWGRFQIMGFNYKSAGFGSVEDFVDAMFQSEGKQLDAFVSFLKNSHLDTPLRQKRWADFARGYNGPGYADNQYDKKLENAYEKYS